MFHNFVFVFCDKCEHWNYNGRLSISMIELALHALSLGSIYKNKSGKIINQMGREKLVSIFLKTIKLWLVLVSGYLADIKKGLCGQDRHLCISQAIEYTKYERARINVVNSWRLSLPRKVLHLWVSSVGSSSPQLVCVSVPVGGPVVGSVG